MPEFLLNELLKQRKIPVIQQIITKCMKFSEIDSDIRNFQQICNFISIRIFRWNMW